MIVARAKFQGLQAVGEIDISQGLIEVESENESLKAGRKFDTNQRLIEIPPKYEHSQVAWKHKSGNVLVVLHEMLEPQAGMNLKFCVGYTHQRQ